MEMENEMLFSQNTARVLKSEKRKKNTFLTEDIGIKSDNFTSVIILSTIIAIGTLFTMYYFWRI